MAAAILKSTLLPGPSEILVVADSQNNPDWIAWDLLSQAEHDPSAQSILITDSEIFAQQFRRQKVCQPMQVVYLYACNKKLR